MGQNERWLTKPRFARDLIWSVDEAPRVTSAFSTLYEQPVPRPPENELNNVVALKTIAQHQHLFKIVTPINVDHFEQLLITHPNQRFVRSVCIALREGFWPWARTDGLSHPATWDNSDKPLRNEAYQVFVREQRDIEVKLGQFSPAFGSKLLPGMYSMPIWVVPKPHTEKLRMVVDQSAEPYSQNSLIPKTERSVHLDNIHDLGVALRQVHSKFPNKRLVLWKSDVSRAYRLAPMSPLWQIRQIVTIDGERHVDRCNNFGNGAAGRVWGSIAGLMLWIAMDVKNIQDLFGYVDDDFSWEFEDNLEWYGPYQKFMPSKQTRFLELWDELGIPHEERKQVSGAPLTVIGFDVDPNTMTVTMPPQSRSDLITAIRDFAKLGQRHPLRDFQSLAGWINWALNVFPLLRPGLSALYAKMAGKCEVHQPIWVNKSVRDELTWLADHIEASDGIHLLDSLEWAPQEAGLTLYADACPFGLAFWSPQLELGFQCPVDMSRPYGIFYLEALAVLSALDFACHSLPPLSPRQVAIYTDNSNTVDAFNTLHAMPLHNPLLITAVDLSITFNIKFRVFHIPGNLNVVADALSRFNASLVLQLTPHLLISLFIPPRLTLGASAL